MKNPIKNPWTTATGSVLIILSGLTLYGVVSAEESASLGQYATIIISAISGIVGIFIAKDKGGGV